MGFLEKMRAAWPTVEQARERRWVFVPYDRLNDRIGPLARLQPEEAGLILIESHAKGRNRPYHKKKVLVVLSNMRHFALEQQARGVLVAYRNAPESYGGSCLPFSRSLGWTRLKWQCRRSANCARIWTRRRAVGCGCGWWRTTPGCRPTRTGRPCLGVGSRRADGSS